DHDGQHEIRAPAVQGANEPSQRDLVVESLQAAPGLSRRGHVDQGQENPGHNLKKEYREGCAAENIPPTRGLARHRMLHHLPDWPPELKALIEPFTHSSH